MWRGKWERGKLGGWLGLVGEKCWAFFLLVLVMKKSEMRWTKIWDGRRVSQICHITENSVGPNKYRLTFGWGVTYTWPSPLQCLWALTSSPAIGTFPQHRMGEEGRYSHADPCAPAQLGLLIVSSSCSYTSCSGDHIQPQIAELAPWEVLSCEKWLAGQLCHVKKKCFDFLLFKRLCKWEQLNRVVGTFSRYVLLLCLLSAVGWNEASGAVLSFSLTVMCVPLWQEGSGNWKWELLVQSCKGWGWGLAAAGSYTAAGCEIWVGLTVSKRGLMSELFECSALGSALPLRWEHLEVPTDISRMIWTWREVRPRKSWWISLGFIPSTSGSIGLAICWRDGLHRNNVRLN